MRFRKAREKIRKKSINEVSITSLLVSSKPDLIRQFTREGMLLANVRSTSHRIRIADKNRCSVHNAVYMCYYAFHINYEGSERLSRKKVDSIAYRHTYIQSLVYIYAYSFYRIFCERRYNRAVCRHGTKKDNLVRRMRKKLI